MRPDWIVVGCDDEQANLAEKLGTDIESVCRGSGSNRRSGYDFQYACGG